MGETVFFGCATISVMVLCVIFLGDCRDIPLIPESKIGESESDIYNKWTCADDQYNPLATLFLNTEGATIKSLFHYSETYKIDQINLFIFGFVWYIFTITSYGLWCPAGLFLPGIITGGSMGRFYTVFMQNWQGYHDKNEIM